MKGPSRKPPAPPRPRGVATTALGLGPVPKGKLVVRSESLPPEDGWFDPRTLNEDTEPPPTARLDAMAVDANEVELSDSFDDTVELPFSHALIPVVSQPPSLPGAAPISAPEPSMPPPLPPEASLPPPLPVSVVEMPRSSAASPPIVPQPRVLSQPPALSQAPALSQPRALSQRPMLSRPPRISPEVTGIPSSPWLVMPAETDIGVLPIDDEPSTAPLSSAAVFVSRRPPPQVPRRGAGIRYAIVALSVAAAAAGVAWGFHQQTARPDALAQASYAHVMPPAVVVAAPAPVASAAPASCAPLDVKSAAPGYKVYVDGKPQGPAPGTFELECGQHTVALMHANRGVISKTIRRVDIGKDKTTISYTWTDIAPR